MDSSHTDKYTPFLSVIIPCYNEEKIIDDTLKSVVAYLSKKGHTYEVIVVDDCSSDNTVKTVSPWVKSGAGIKLLKNERNRGKGLSVRRGMLEAKGKYVCFSDADLSTPIEEIEKLLRWIEEGFDVAIGSRSLRESKIEVRQPWWREGMGKTFNFFVRILAFKGIKDTQCGFKCFKGEVAGEIFSRQRLDGFSFDVEALYIAMKLGYRIKEVPIRWKNRFESRVNPVVHSLQMFKDLFTIRLRYLRGGYNAKRNE